MSKRLILSLRSNDGERVDEITFVEGDVLMRNQGKDSPLVAISALEGARFEDTDAAAAARAARARLTAVYQPEKGNPHE